MVVGLLLSVLERAKHVHCDDNNEKKKENDDMFWQ